MFRVFIAILVLLRVAPAAEPRVCVASVPLGSFDITVRPPVSDEPRPLREVNAIEPGYIVAYKPANVPKDLKEDGRIALILIPEDTNGKLAVFEPHAVSLSAQWVAPFRVGAVGLVIGPHGLDQDRVSSLLKKDRELMTQLADYAAQTQRVENLVQTLSEAERTPSMSLDTALSGFAERYGTNAPKLDRNAPTDQQAQVLVRALLPSLNSYDPLATQPSARMQQSAGLAASIAALFFGSNVGLAAGGAAMVANLRTLMFPSTDFRSALAQQAEDGTMTLCSARQPQKSRTRLAYLWGYKVAGGAAPKAALRAPANVLRGTRAVLPADGDWRRLERARDWALVREATRVLVPVRVTPQGLDVDLVRVSIEPGVWQLAARWDWQPLVIAGAVNVHAAPDLSNANVRTPLVEGTGPVLVSVTGGDFRFVTELRLGGRPLDFTHTDTLRFTLDTNTFKAGRYKLGLKLADSSIQEIPLRVLPPNPKISNLPLRANLGEERQTITLRGSGLDRIEKIESDGAGFELAPAGSDPGQRDATIRLTGAPVRGARLSAALSIEGLPEPVKLPEIIEVAGPRPRIEHVDISLPDDLGVALRDGELPAGSFASISMRVEHGGSRPALHLTCDDVGAPVTLRAGEKNGRAKLEMAGSDVLFLSLDAAAAGRPGCALTAGVEGEDGVSDARPLGRVIRLPRIESFTLTDEKAGESAYYGSLTGQDLELIAKTGWNARDGLPVESLPKPVGDKQNLRVALPWPSPSPRAPLYIWLRGEAEGRQARAHL